MHTDIIQENNLTHTK